MSVNVIEVVPVDSRKALREFTRLPWKLYAGDAQWVPPLLVQQKQLFNRRRHPFYEQADCRFFLARRHGEAVGRIAAIVDRRYGETHGEPVGSFGFFECIDDRDVAERLLAAACRCLAERGMSRILGPFNPSANYECGVLVEGFDTPPTVMMPHNPPYYASLLESAGFCKVRDLYGYWVDDRFQPSEKLRRVAQRVSQRGRFTIRGADLRQFPREIGRVREIYNTAWQSNWGFVPMSDAEFDALARELKFIVRPEFVLFAEADGRTVGFLLALPDVNQVLKRLNGRLFPLGFLRLWFGLRRINVLRVPIMGFLPEYQNLGAAAAMYLELERRARTVGVVGLEMSWVLEDNTMMRRAAEMLGGRRHKVYRIYGRDLSSAVAR